MTTPTLPPAARRAGRVLAWTLGAVLLVAVIAAVWIGVRGATAYGHLARIHDQAAAGVTALADDPATAATDLQHLAGDAAEAHSLTSDLVWRGAEHLPWIGPQLSAFAAVAASSDELLGGSLLPLARAADGLSVDALRPVGGRIDATVLAPLAAPARDAATASADAASTVRGIDRAPLAGVVARAVDDADVLFTRVSGAVDALARTSALLPAMLGHDGARTYLVVVQNNAEWRSLGGIAGAGVLVRADHGALSLAGTLSSRDFAGGFPQAVLPLSDEVTAIYEDKPARYFQNVTQVPDFAVGAPLAREMYRLTSGLEVDGVLAVDPVVLSYLLGATGPVALPTGGTLTADTAVPLLLNEVYFRYADPADQDAFFAAAAGAVFQALADGQGSAAALLDAITRAAGEHRLLVWSANPSEQQLVDGSTVAGALPTTDEHTARFGVYLNDGTGSKMSYYTRPDVSLAWTACPAAGQLAARELTLGLTLTSDAPADAAISLPEYITGGGAFGTPAGVTEVVGNIYLPEGFELVSADGAPKGFAGGMHEGRRVLSFGIDLEPGGSTSITVAVRATTRAASAEAIVTPTADAARATSVPATCGVG